MSPLHCMLTAQPSKLDTFLWRLFQLFTLSLECQCCLSADTTSAYFLFFFYFLRRSQPCLSFCLRWAGNALQVEPRVREREENGGWKSATSGSQKKALKQILSRQRAQMRYLTKGNNYLSNEANLKLSNKNKLHCECKEMQLFKWDGNANVWSYVEETRSQELASYKNQTPYWLIIFCNGCQCPCGHVPFLKASAILVSQLTPDQG